MKAARIHKNSRSLTLDEVPVPKISTDEVLVKVRAAGVCHTELHFLDGVIPFPGEALTLGHEIAGTIVEIGENVRGLATGDRVIVNNEVGCNHCTQCLKGRENLCDSLQQIGFSLDGGFAEYVKVRSDLCLIIPDSISFESGAALTCGSASCYHALFDIGGLTSGEMVLINGMGGVGFSGLQIVNSVGAKCIAVDIVDEKLRIAENQFGAYAVINGRREAVEERVNAITKGKGVDILLELVGTQATMRYSIQVLAKRGRTVFIGYSQSDFVVSPLSMILKEAAVLASIAYTKANLTAVRDLAAGGKLNPLVVERFDISEINKALELLKTGSAIGRSVVVFD